ncbi:T9SS type A sorting domain-containing protein [Seonamhaeicola sp.]|uniref:T9SS type A sorting domain-containing protein n=1 Tax=Seonamhaeicola sp. TaxID=1912245 RepID=UPI00262C0713|nr:T9SS type A sorting domain-containing protein [Seonamhaeicola sp.]
MKKITYLILLLIAFNFGYGQSIFDNPVTGTNPGLTNPYVAGQSFNSNITVSGIVRGIGAIGFTGNNGYYGRSWDTGSLDNTAYYGFTLTPNTGYEIDFVSFVYTGQASGSGPNSVAFRSSLDSYAADIGSPTIAGTTIDLSGASYQNIDSAITFRFYAWGASDANETFSLDDFTFNGTVSALGSCATVTTWNGTSWDNGTPTSTAVAVIDANYTTNVTNGSFSACTLIVTSGNTLTVDNGYYVEVENDVEVDGTIAVQTRGSFVQNDNGGTFTLNGSSYVNKETPAKPQWWYYTYWSSPVSGETINGAFPSAPTDRRFYFNASNYIDADGDDIDDDGNDWRVASGTDVLTPGVGYAATASTFHFPGGTEIVTFDGAFNTGNISTPIVYNAINTTGSWNFIGNPYPSAIDFDAFHTANSGVVAGAAYFWSQFTLPDNTIPGNELSNFSQNDYATYTVGSGGVAGASGVIPDQYVPSGQAFFIAGLANGNVTFTNAMRMADGTSNAQFFKNTTTKKSGTYTANKLWVNLTSDNGVYGQILIAYVAGATNNDDGLYYDAPRLPSDVSATLYSKIESSDRSFAIQGKAESSLDENETVQLGFKTNIEVATLYTLSLAQVQGDFLSTSPIYIKDNLLDKVHDLTTDDYTFTSEVGEFNGRFVIAYNSSALLSTEDALLSEGGLSIVELEDDNVRFSVSNNVKLKSVKIYDLLGRALYNFKTASSSETFNLSKLKSSVFIAKVELSNGITISKKAVKKY